MPSDLREKLAAFAAEMAAVQRRLQGLERNAATLREEVEHLRSDLERGGNEEGTQPPLDEGESDEWDRRVPTRPLIIALQEGDAGTDPAGGRPGS